MTGTSVFLHPHQRVILTSGVAQEAMEFGIVDGILERRPTSDTSGTAL